MPDSEISGPSETGAKGVLMKKIGPLPLVAWVLIGVGAAAAIIYLRNRNKPAASPNGVSATGAGTGVPAGTTPYDVQLLTDAIGNMEKLLAGQAGNTTVNSGTTTASVASNPIAAIAGWWDSTTAFKATTRGSTLPGRSGLGLIPIFSIPEVNAQYQTGGIPQNTAYDVQQTPVTNQTTGEQFYQLANGAFIAASDLGLNLSGNSNWQSSSKITTRGSTLGGRTGLGDIPIFSQPIVSTQYQTGGIPINTAYDFGKSPVTNPATGGQFYQLANGQYVAKSDLQL